MVDLGSTIHRPPGFCKGLLGEGEAARPFEEIDTGRPSLGLGKGLPGERALRNPGLGARKSPHRMPVGTPASASPPGEGEEGWAGVGSSATVVAGGGRATGRPLTFILAKSPEFSSPLGEGEAARPFEEIDTGRPSLGLGKGLPGERALRNPGLGARKTPHRLPVGTASASPPGEGEEGRARRREFGHAGCWGWAHDRKTPHLLLAKTPAFSSPLGEGEAARPFEEIDTDARPSGYATVSQEGERTALPRRDSHLHPPATTAPASPRGEAKGRPRGQGLCRGF